jgi:Tol biopolymer transport system component
VVSKSGRYIAFGSSATNLHPNDTNGWVDIFLRDLVTGQVTLVSQTPAGFSGNGLSYNPDLSDDGRYVVFHSAATDLVANDTNATWDVFRFDQMTGTLMLVTQSSSGVQGNSHSNWSYVPSVSADGRFVTYSSYSDNLVPNDTNGGTDVFLTELPPGP